MAVLDKLMLTLTILTIKYLIIIVSAVCDDTILIKTMNTTKEVHKEVKLSFLLHHQKFFFNSGHGKRLEKNDINKNQNK